MVLEICRGHFELDIGNYTESKMDVTQEMEQRAQWQLPFKGCRIISSTMGPAYIVIRYMVFLGTWSIFAWSGTECDCIQ